MGTYHCLYFKGRIMISLLQKLVYESTLTTERLFLLYEKDALKLTDTPDSLSKFTLPSNDHSPAAMLIANRQSNRPVSVIEFIWKKHYTELGHITCIKPPRKYAILKQSIWLHIFSRKTIVFLS